MTKNRIIQLTPTISYGDAVSNDVFAMADILTKRGYNNLIVAYGASKKVEDRVVLLQDFKSKPSDVFIYHMSIGSGLTEYVINAKLSVKLWFITI